MLEKTFLAFDGFRTHNSPITCQTLNDCATTPLALIVFSYKTNIQTINELLNVINHYLGDPSVLLRLVRSMIPPSLNLHEHPSGWDSHWGPGGGGCPCEVKSRCPNMVAYRSQLFIIICVYLFCCFLSFNYCYEQFENKPRL